MINKLYANTVVKKGKMYSLQRFLLRNLYNLLYPVKIIFKKKNILSFENNVIVSLTSFPTRIDKVWIVIETIFEQTYKPDRIVLTLSELQFPERKIPQKLLDQTRRGLEIIWTEDDIRSHKKYYYVMKKYPDSIIITIDDDILYEKSLIEKLFEFHFKYPQSIICNWACIIKGENYSNWKNLLFTPETHYNKVQQIGVGGVLYPPHSLDKRVFDKELFLDICPLADDIWLNVMARINNTHIIKTDYQYYFIPIYIKQNLTLESQNNGLNMNNVQIKEVYSKFML